MVDIAQALGLDDSAIDWHSLEVPVHCDVVAPLQRLKAAAAEAGFDLRIASGFRDYHRQLAIWNGKASGERPVMDSDGVALDIKALADDWQRCSAIMRWSAIPGCSRHHWGSDVDVYDAAAVAEDYALQLSPEEVADNGPFGLLHRWLDERMACGTAEGFYRPYAEDIGGVAPERWHLSFAPLAERFVSCLNMAAMESALAARGDIALWPELQKRWQQIYPKYVALSA